MMPDPARSVGDEPTMRPATSVGNVTTCAGDPARAAIPAAFVAPTGYVIERELGRGGMGVVYLAHQTGLNRPVAMKVVLGDAADEKALIRFLAEAETVAAIRHPNVVQVYQYGESAGRPYLSLEYLSGGSLAEAIERGECRRPHVVAAVMVQIADGVQAAHALGIVHRDLKPHNVLFDANGVPKVTDFGLAKRAAGGDLTNTNAILGTPAYMAPEQAKGETKFVGPEADVWSLGVMLYELLTGKRPFDGPNPWTILKGVIETTPATVRSVSAAVPRDLSLICDKCLTKDKADRYQSAGELAADLRRFLAGEPVRATPDSLSAGFLRWAAQPQRAHDAGMNMLLFGILYAFRVMRRLLDHMDVASSAAGGYPQNGGRIPLGTTDEIVMPCGLKLGRLDGGWGVLR